MVATEQALASDWVPVGDLARDEGSTTEITLIYMERATDNVIGGMEQEHLSTHLNSTTDVEK